MDGSWTLRKRRAVGDEFRVPTAYARVQAGQDRVHSTCVFPHELSRSWSILTVISHLSLILFVRSQGDCGTSCPPLHNPGEWFVSLGPLHRRSVSPTKSIVDAGSFIRSLSNDAAACRPPLPPKHPTSSKHRNAASPARPEIDSESCESTLALCSFQK